MPKNNKRRSANEKAHKPEVITIQPGEIQLKVNSNMQLSELQFDQHGRLVTGNATVSSNVVLRPLKRGQRDPARKMLKDLYADGIPSRDQLSDLAMFEKLKEGGYTGSLESARRAAGRRRR